jgi:hypothetical protein
MNQAAGNGAVGRGRRLALRLGAALAALVIAGCVVYEPVPVAAGPSRFDRAWAAAVGAMQDQGVAITEQDRTRGIVRGGRGGLTVTANVLTQADGRVRVEFNTTGTLGSDPTLVDRISASYDRRMGR